LPLLNDAIDWMSRIGPFMTGVAAKLWQERIEIEALPRRQQHARLRALYEEIGRESTYSELVSALQLNETGPHDVLCRAMTVTQGAAVIVLLFMVGMRVRELIRLDANCVQVEDNWAAVPVSYLNGIAAKAAG